MSSAKLRGRNQITLTAKIVKALGLNEGDEIDSMVSDGKLIGTPKISVDKSQSWYFSEMWQKQEALAEKELHTLIETNFKEVPDVFSVEDVLDNLKKAIY